MNGYIVVCGELIDGFEVEVIVAQFWAATLTKWVGRELGTVPDRHTTDQLTPATGEAGLGHRARLETSNVPFISHKKTSASLHCTVSVDVLVKPIWAGEKEGRGKRGRTALLQTESKLFTMKAEGDAEEEDPFFLSQPLISCRSTSERCVWRRFPSPPAVRWRPAGAVIEAEWMVADGQEREGPMKRARRMALAPAGEQSAGSQDECVHVCAFVWACELNLISSACLTKRGNKLSNERKWAVMVLTVFWDLVSVSRVKKDTCKEPYTQKSERRERKSGVYQESAPPPFFTHKGQKVSLIWGCRPAYPPPSFQAPFDEAGPGQEHRWLQGRGKTSVFMVGGVLSIWVKPSHGGSAPGC